MHTKSADESVIDQTIERRGNLHPLTDFRPERTALIVVDMQNYFIDMVPTARQIVDNINRLADGLRRTGGQVAWIAMTVSPDDAAGWSHFYTKLLSPQMTDSHFEDLRRDAEGWQIWHELEVDREDWLVEKNRFSAFIQGSSDLEARLRTKAIDTVLITGTVTNVCCESTARDAMMLDFQTIIVSDACAAHTDAAHVATLNNFQSIFGDVFSVEELLLRIERAALPRQASG
jgi:ureidoacrylate peracid hydrolase